MDKETFIAHYKGVLGGTSDGVEIIRNYIMDEGNSYHKEHITDFLKLLYIPPLYKHCLQRAIEYYVVKFSIVVVTKQDPNTSMPNTEVVTIY